MTESYYIHVSLNKEKTINYLQDVIFDIFTFSTIETEGLKWVYDKAINGGTERESSPNFLSYYNQLRFDYTGNDSGVPADIFIEFYSQLLNYNSKEFYITGFNSAGSDLINIKYNKIADALISKLSKQNLLVNVIYTFDSIYQTPELFQITNKLKSETGIVGIIT